MHFPRMCEFLDNKVPIVSLNMGKMMFSILYETYLVDLVKIEIIFPRDPFARAPVAPLLHRDLAYRATILQSFENLLDLFQACYKGLNPY